MVRYLARHSDRSVVKAAIISAVPPLMVKTAANPGGFPKSVFDDFRRNLPPIARNSIARFRKDRSTASTARARKNRKRSSPIGGGRA